MAAASRSVGGTSPTGEPPAMGRQSPRIDELSANLIQFGEFRLYPFADMLKYPLYRCQSGKSCRIAISE
jgi:hypothetical protein